MFTLIEKTRMGDAIFIDWQNTDFYFLVIISSNEQNALSISYGYKNIEWGSAEMLENRLPPNIHDKAKLFSQKVNAYAQIDNPEFIAELEAAGLYFDSQNEENITNTFSP